mgnify:CR=1 FL=1
MLLLGTLLSLPVVQTKIGSYVTNSLNEDFGTDINIQKVSISVFGTVNLKEVLIRDHHKDTLIYVNRLQTKIQNFKKIINGDLLFGAIKLDHVLFNLKTYKNEKNTNLDYFVSAFDSDKPSTGKFLMTATKIQITKGHFKMSDDNQKTSKILDFSKIYTNISDFKIYGTDLTFDIHQMYLKDYRGLIVENLETNFTYSKKNILLEELKVRTKKSLFYGDVAMEYDVDKEDFADFNNKVLFDIKIDSSLLATNDIRYFYKEISADNIFNLKGDVDGTLNDLKINNLVLTNDKNTEIYGDIRFKNLFAPTNKDFLMNGTFEKLTSNYGDLTNLLPNILGKTLPSALDKLGQFTLNGTSRISTSQIETVFTMDSALGTVFSDLQLVDIQNIDNASYKGTIILDKFNVGKFIENSDLGLVSLNVDVNGKGFTKNLINTKIEGKINKIQYNNYNYSDITLNGIFKNPYFSGKIHVNDPNLFMDFEGLVDVSKRENVYDFEAKIDYANLYQLNLIKSDTISIFKGNITSKLVGNTINSIYGDIVFEYASFQNKRDIYVFDEFKISSTFNENRERTIEINSPDIVEGRVVGKFAFEQLPLIFENSLGSTYRNYSLNKVNKGQYLKFNFSIYNKIIEVFYPDITVSPNTFIKGNIKADTNDFKLSFSSPDIKINNFDFEKIKIEVDNKNPLFNTFIEIDSIKNNYYKISEFNLINVTKNDSLLVRTEFKGGNTGTDFYNLNLYHTIDKSKNNVIGIQKSELFFKENFWFLNEDDNTNNRIIIDQSFNSFQFDQLRLSHENQEILLNGSTIGSNKKDLNLNFNQVNLDMIIPEIEGLALQGVLNGAVNFEQDNQFYKPITSLQIDDFVINAIDLGTLNLDVDGDESLTKFNILSSITHEDIKKFNVEGSIEIVDKKPVMDLNLNLNKFNLGAFKDVGGEVIANIRGFATGNATFMGTLENPEMEGRIYLNEAGLTVPYLNVDYALQNNSVVDLTQRQFLLRNIGLTDTKYNSKGVLSGNIRHNKLEEWKMDIELNSDYINVLDTQDSDDAIYYGKAFIAGRATITGPTNALVIDVNATSKKGTAIKIPLAETESVGESTYIHFMTKEEKYSIETGQKTFNRNYQGLEMNFDLTITEDAEIEVILDKETGHLIRGKGFGNLALNINTQGKFNMYGDFSVNEGIYNFKYRGLISKQFKVKKYGSIVWEGDPMRARLNLEAIYDNIRANPAVMLENTTVNQKVPVVVTIGITGNLNNPEPDFFIDFPTISSVLKSEIETKLNDKDTRQTQALYLLATGNFLSYDGNTSQNGMANNLFETFTGVFNDIIGEENSNFNLGLDVVTADRTPGRETDGSVGFTGSFEINERISVNGKLGVPIGGINDAAVVGNVEILYRVNEDGSLNMRVFNRENDITYIGEGIGYTQGIGVSYQVDFNTFRELITKVFKNAKLTKDTTPTSDLVPDSEMLPEYIKMPAKKKPTGDAKKEEEEKAPEID